jgi:hypothetical protein
MKKVKQIHLVKTTFEYVAQKLPDSLDSTFQHSGHPWTFHTQWQIVVSPSANSFCKKWNWIPFVAVRMGKKWGGQSRKSTSHSIFCWIQEGGGGEICFFRSHLWILCALQERTWNKVLGGESVRGIEEGRGVPPPPPRNAYQEVTNHRKAATPSLLCSVQDNLQKTFRSGRTSTP